MKTKIRTDKNTVVHVQKEPTDPICLRASIGGTRKLGYYITFRGDDWDDVEEMLEHALKAYKQVKAARARQN